MKYKNWSFRNWHL